MKVKKGGTVAKRILLAFDVAEAGQPKGVALSIKHVPSRHEDAEVIESIFLMPRPVARALRSALDRFLNESTPTHLNS